MDWVAWVLSLNRLLGLHVLYPLLNNSQTLCLPALVGSQVASLEEANRQLMETRSGLEGGMLDALKSQVGLCGGGGGHASWHENEAGSGIEKGAW